MSKILRNRKKSTKVHIEVKIKPEIGLRYFERMYETEEHQEVDLEMKLEDGEGWRKMPTESISHEKWWTKLLKH